MPSVSPDKVDYGTDLWCVSDLTSDMSEVSGRTLLAQALARRLQTPRGGLIDDPDYGFDVTAYIDDDLTDREIARIRTGISAECVKDERVSSVTVTTTFAKSTLVIAIDVVDLQGPFRLVLAATSVTISILKVAA